MTNDKQAIAATVARAYRAVKQAEADIAEAVHARNAMLGILQQVLDHAIAHLERDEPEAALDYLRAVQAHWSEAVPPSATVN